MIGRQKQRRPLLLAVAAMMSWVSWRSFENYSNGIYFSCPNLDHKALRLVSQYLRARREIVGLRDRRLSVCGDNLGAAGANANAFLGVSGKCLGKRAILVNAEHNMCPSVFAGNNRKTQIQILQCRTLPLVGLAKLGDYLLNRHAGMHGADLGSWLNNK